MVYYLKALSVKSESDEDHELYKALELFKNLYHGWEKAADNIGYPFSKWKNLKYNLTATVILIMSKMALLKFKQCLGKNVSSQ